MANKADRTGAPKGALSQLGALRDRLAAADAGFDEAARLERHAEAFCDRVRADLKAYRLAQNINQKELAKRLDLSQSAISKAENGRGDLSLKTVFRIAAALGFAPVVAFESAAVQAHAPTVGKEEYAAAAAALAAVQEDLIRQAEIVQDAVALLATE